MKDGTWTFNEKTRILKIFNNDKQEVKSFEIAVIKENKLILKN